MKKEEFPEAKTGEAAGASDKLATSWQKRAQGTFEQ